MNKTYRIIWNPATGCHVAVQETAKGRGKSTLGPSAGGVGLLAWTRVLASCALTAMSVAGMTQAHALQTTCSGTASGTSVTASGSLTLQAYNPIDNDCRNGQFVVGGGSTAVTLGGSARQMVRGQQGGSQWVSLGTMLDAGQVLSGSEYVQGSALNFDPKQRAISYYDPVDKQTKTGLVYDTSALKLVNNTSVTTPSTDAPVGDNQYIDMRVATVDTSGGKLNIAIGDPSQASASLDNYVRVKSKQTTMFQADGNGGAAASELHWTGRNRVDLGQVNIPLPPATDPNQYQDVPVSVTSFTGLSYTAGGVARQVTDAASFADYNTWLIGEITANRIPFAQYDAQLRKAYTTTAKTVRVSTAYQDNGSIEESRNPVGDRVLMGASGAGATAQVDAGARLDLQFMLAGLRAGAGGTVINNGMIATEDRQAARLMQVDAGGTGVNNGVLTEGFLTADGATRVASDYTSHPAVWATGAGAKFTNNGIVNISGTDTLTDIKNGGLHWGLYAEAGASATNAASGIVNLGVGDKGHLGSAPLVGLYATGAGSTGTNNGEIYIGRRAQFDTARPEAVPDTVVTNGGGAMGIYAATASVTNSGRITIGSQADNSSAIYANKSSTVNNSGTITIKARDPGAGALPLANTGIYLADVGTNVATHSGTINIDGLNSAGVRLVTNPQFTSSKSTLTSTGTININGGADPATGTRNFGLHVTGTRASANLAGGDINLAGDGAIGVLARDGGSVTLSGGNLNFVQGKDQIGFNIVGAGSKVTLARLNKPLDANTEGSTLFRVEDGAKMNANAAPLTASGKNATAIQATGTGASVNLAGANITAAGEGAVAIRVEGGASAQMDRTARLQLGDGTTAVVVDNHKYDLSGAQVGTGQSVFTNTASVDAGTARNVTVFSVVNGGRVVNSGDVHVAHGIGFDVSGAGSEVVGDATGMQGRIAVDDGTAGIYVHGGAALDSTDKITVNHGASGVLVGADAGKVVLRESARVTGLGEAAGNLVNNQSASAGNVLVDGATLEMAGTGAALLSEQNIDAASHGHVIVSGAGKGIALSKADGSATTGSLALGSNWDIDVSGSGAGVYANTSGKLDVSSQALRVTGAGTGIRVDAADTVTVQAGAQISATQASAVLVAGAPRTLINQGTLQGVAGSDAVRLDDSGHDFQNTGGGAITGNVRLGNGSNTALLEASTLNGDLSGGTGRDTVTLRGNAVGVSGVIDGGVGASNDTLVLDGANMTHDADSRQTHFENVQLRNAATLTLKTAMKLDDDQSDSRGFLDVDRSSTLAVAPGTAFALNNRLSGDGLLSTDTGGQAFDFTSNVGNAFTGTVRLGNSRFALGGPATRALGSTSGDTNTATLGNATLELGAGSITTVGDGDQLVGGLKFSGGTAKFNADAPDATVAKSTITTAQLDASGTGAVQINVPAPYQPAAPAIDSRASLMEQDDGAIGVKLVNAGSTVGTGAALVLQDQNGTQISNRRTVDIAQGGQLVAKGEYDYGLATRPDDGLYVNYGLQKLDIQQGQTLSLQQRPGASGNAADLSAQLVGTGGLAVNAGDGAVSLSNTLNSYTGETTVNSGTLRMAADNALGQTSALQLKAGTRTELDRFAQSVGALKADAGSTLDLQAGALDIRSGGRADGTLQGGGQLRILGGKLAVAGDNAALTAATTIAGGAEAALRHTGGLGSGAIRNDGVLTLDAAQGQLVNAVSGAGGVALANGADVELSGNNTGFSGVFNIAEGATLTASEASHLGTAKLANAGTLVVANGSDWTLANAVDGTGAFVKDGAGVLDIGDAVRHTGTTSINNGTLIVGDAQHASRTLGADGAGEVSVAKAATLAGAGTVNGHVNNDGVIGALNTLPGQAGAANGTLTLAKGLDNRGTIDLRGPEGSTPGNVLRVQGDYVGSDATMLIRTRMGDDASATDKLVVDGGRASGKTAVVVKSAGGQGAQTAQGIRIVETRNGGSTDAGAFALSTSSDGYRQGAGTLAIGAYDYGLVRGGNGGQAEDWYLNSAANGVAAKPTDPTGATGPDAATGAGPTPMPATATPSYRPEVGAYLANRQAAMMMTAHTLHERQGQAPGVDGKDLQQSSDANGWLRMSDSVSSFGRSGSSIGSVSGGSHLIHGGADLLRLGDGAEGSIRVGAMGAYGSTRSDVSNAGLHARGSVEGYSAGIYGTWYGQRDMISGPYVDAWVMGGSYDNKVQGQGLAQESYKSRGTAASLEAGYSFKVFDDGQRQMFVEPQAQVIASRYSAGDHTEASGTVVSGMKDSGVTTRLGVRIHGHAADDAGNRMMRPFAELNWWHGKSTQTMQFNADRVNAALPSNRVEAKVGLQGNLTKTISAWGSVGGEVGERNYKAGEVQAGIKYSW